MQKFGEKIQILTKINGVPYSLNSILLKLSRYLASNLLTREQYIIGKRGCQGL